MMDLNEDLEEKFALSTDQFKGNNSTRNIRKTAAYALEQ